jgi:HAD superfamily hydrolase (TIGR01549 family)
MREYDVYLFDWDGTLADSTAVWLRIIRRQLEAIDIHPTEDELIRSIGDWKNVKALGLSDIQLAQTRTATRQEMLEQLPTIPLFDGAHGVLQQLKQKKKKLAVVTSMHRPIIDALIAHHGYGQLFDVVISGDDVKNLKPHPEALLLAMDKLKRRPHETVLMLGDADRDILAAHQAGVDSLLYYPRQHQMFHDLEELRAHNPTHIITQWKEFSV